MKVELKPRDPEKHVCFVGYDTGHSTFFVYVANKGETGKRGQVLKNNHVVIWFGTKEREITTVREVKELITPFAELPAEVERGLLACEEKKGIEQAATK